MTKRTNRADALPSGTRVTAWRGGYSEPIRGHVVRHIDANSLGRKHPAHVVVRSDHGSERAYPLRYTNAIATRP
ncbi:hypothetical protein [Pseudoclavibacter helvolus]|uniref:hypothetical protein n=1 Tax=Pseudoclavibacter helvolus TaxID=255205 RepID=UPI003C730258